MQDEINEKYYAFIIRTGQAATKTSIRTGTKLLTLSGKALYSIIKHTLLIRLNSPGVYKPVHGRNSIRMLTSTGENIVNVDIEKDFKSDFEKIMRNNGIQYAIKYDQGASNIPPHFIFYFKEHDLNTLESALNIYAHKMTRNFEKKSSNLDKAMARDIDDVKLKRKKSVISKIDDKKRLIAAHQEIINRSRNKSRTLVKENTKSL